MNRKGFTLIELVIVILIIGIISVITIPSILKSWSSSQAEAGADVEKILEENMELYTIDNKDALWCNKDDFYVEDENGGIKFDQNAYEKCSKKDQDTIYITLNDLYTKNPNIDLGDCKILKKDDASDWLEIKRFENNNKYKYQYTAKIVCSKEFKNDSSLNNENSVSEAQIVNLKYYYKSK